MKARTKGPPKSTRQTSPSMQVAPSPRDASRARRRASIAGEESTQVRLAPASASGTETRPVPAINSTTGPFAPSARSRKNGTSDSSRTKPW